MFRITLSLLFCLSCIRLAAAVIKYDDNHVIYCDEISHLEYMLNTETKEAMLGNGIDKEKNALYYPPIGDDWWNNQTNLWGDVVVPSSVEYNGETYVVTEVANYAFCRATELTTIQLPETIQRIGFSAFELCTELIKVNIPEGVKKISSKAFYTCRQLKELKLPSTIEEIESGAFMDCVLLESISIPGKCASIGCDAFSWCIALKSLTFEDGEAPIHLGYAYEFGPMWEPYAEPYCYSKPFGRGLFNDCPIKDLYIGRNIEYDNQFNIVSPFENCIARYGSNGTASFQHTGRSFRKVVFGNSVTEIHAKLFKGASIPNLLLPDNITRINDEAFYEAFNQSQLVLPAKCDSIGDLAFVSLNNNLKFIECKSNKPPRIHSSSFSGYIRNIMVTVPAGMRSTFENSSVWKDFYLCDPNDELVEINVKYANSLYGRLALLDKNPSDVFRLKLSGVLGADDFEVLNSMNLYELDMSELTCEDLTPIKSAFAHIKNFKFPKGIKKIQTDLFRNSYLQGEIRIPKECEIIEANAFRLLFINKLIIEGPTVVEESAFSFCKKLSEIEISGGATLKDYSFQYIYNLDDPNGGLETLSLGDGVTVCSRAFSSCRHLTNITINGEVASIGNYAFWDCDSIKSMTFNGSISHIEENAFKLGEKEELMLEELHINDIKAWCSNEFTSNNNPMSASKKTYLYNSEIDSVEIPSDVNRIGNYSFAGCKNLTKVNILGENTEIGASAFSGCSNLKEVNVSDRITHIGESAFANCSSLVSVVLPTCLETLVPKLFSGCTSLKTINIPKHITNIPVSIFEGCENLKELDIPSSVTAIEHDAFAGCASLGKIEIPLNCNTIDYNAFKNCSSLTDVLLPQHLTVIGENAFSDCSGLSKIQALWTVAPSINTNVFNNINKKAMLYVPVGSVPSYYENGWGRIPLIEEGFCVINLRNNSNGHVKYKNKTYTDNDDVLIVDTNSNIEIEIVPKENYHITSIKLDDTPIQFDNQSTSINLYNVNDNHSLWIEYGRALLGDVNGDSSISITDVICIVSHVLNKTPDVFVPSAADINKDGEITITDAVSLMDIILGKQNN